MYFNVIDRTLNCYGVGGEKKGGGVRCPYIFLKLKLSSRLMKIRLFFAHENSVKFPKNSDFVFINIYHNNS